MFSAHLSSETSPNSQLAKLMNVLRDIPDRLQKRICVPASKFEETLNLREKTHNLAPYSPTGEVSLLSPDTYYLTEVNKSYHRMYSKI